MELMWHSLPLSAHQNIANKLVDNLDVMNEIEVR